MLGQGCSSVSQGGTNIRYAGPYVGGDIPKKLWVSATNIHKNMVDIWCVRRSKKFEEAKILSGQNLMLCYKWQIQTCSLSKQRLNMLSCRRSNLL